MKKHANIPIFIPHLGCPNQCVFCNQRTISGVQDFDIGTVRAQIEDAISTVPNGTECEIAFFGGSFTGIDRELMTELLAIAKEYLDKGLVSSVRCSTRPDYIDVEILDILKKYGVKTVELGLQSTDDAVLGCTKRGHSSLDEYNACKLIKEKELELVGQMMIGLPGSTVENEIQTAKFIIDSGASGVRIYPTVVFRDTELCGMAELGIYEPLSLEDAIERSAMVLEEFIKAKLTVLRIGLCSSDNLSNSNTYYAGPNHPALGELVKSRVYYNRICRQLNCLSDLKDKVLYLSVAKGETSKAVGQKKENKISIMQKYGIKVIKIREDGDLSEYDIRINQ